jgi:metal-sulfur cluster biosynthetic enzyme
MAMQPDNGCDPELDRKVEEALDRVLDPCSCGMGNPVSVRELGLVCDWVFEDDGHLSVRMCVTAPACQMGPVILEGARRRLEEIPEVKVADCWIDASVFWSPDLVTTRGREKMEDRRRRSAREVPVRPQEWRTAKRVSRANA